MFKRALAIPILKGAFVVILDELAVLVSLVDEDVFIMGLCFAMAAMDMVV